MSSNRPVTPNMKVGEVLKEHPQLLDVLVAQSPEFRRLRNPILRRVHGHLVTVAQAATVAGLDAATLVRNLNHAIGQEIGECESACGSAGHPGEAISRPASMAGPTPPLWLATAPRALELDVREHQRRNEDPFAVIMAALPKVGEGQVLLLRNTFEPFPLYDVLSKKGFVAWAREIGPRDWEIHFFKVGKPTSEPSPIPSSAQEMNGETEPTATITIDIRDLTPPEPLMRILDALGRLKQGETLLVHHARRPVHLYPKLAELGCKQKTVERAPGQVDIYIRKGS